MRPLPNWLGTVPNPFDLREPPKGFLRELAAFDDQLVIYPSQETYHYRIARRVRRSPGLSHAMQFGKDSMVCVDHRLLPVTSFGGHLTFGAHVFQYLADRDTWRHGGAKNAADTLDDFDRTKDTQTQKTINAENVARARSMYRTYKTRVGERVSLNDTNRGRHKTQGVGRITFTPARTGSAPVPPTGWNSSASSGLLTPPTLR